MTAKSEKSPKKDSPPKSPEPETTEKKTTAGTGSPTSEFQGDEAPEDLTHELEGVPSLEEDVPGAELGPDPGLRKKVRALWTFYGSMGEIFLGPEMHHDEDDLDALVSASMPVAETMGLEWLGDWIHALVLAGVVYNVEAPKIRAVMERRRRQNTDEAEVVEEEPEPQEDDEGPATTSPTGSRKTPAKLPARSSPSGG